MPFLLLGLGVLGAIVGSFITVVVHRLGSGTTMVWGRSRCIHCGKTLRCYELLPALSFLAQGGQCRSCGGRIPVSYLLIELLTAALFALFAWAVFSGWLAPPPFLATSSGDRPWVGIRGGLAAFLYFAYFTATAVAVSFYDFAHRLIPPFLIWPLAAVGFAGHAAAAYRLGDSSLLLLPLGVGAGAFTLLWAFWFFSAGRAMGRGDADVALAVGLFLEPPASLSGFLFALWLGAGIGILLLATRHLTWKSQMPFAPFLFAGALLALFVSPPWTVFDLFGYGT